MKVRINLTIEDHLLNKIKQYAANKQMSVSELVERYFQNLIKSPGKKNIIEMVEKLERPSISSSKNLKKDYYEAQRKKYGF